MSNNTIPDIAQWIHCLLCPNDPPSCGGGYLPRKLDSYWANWLQHQPHFNEYGHIQCEHTESEKAYYLWYLADWLRTEESRQAQRDYYNKRSNDFMELRYRIERSILVMIRAGSSRTQARELIENLCASRSKYPEMERILQSTKFDDPIDPELFEEYINSDHKEIRFADPFWGIK